MMWQPKYLTLAIVLGSLLLARAPLESQALAEPASMAAPMVVKPNLPKKKLLEYGWDVPEPAYLRDNIREMEKKPFDGVIFRLADKGGNVFDVKNWDEAKLKPQLKTLAAIKWGSFTDNFLTMNAASSMDWFNDADWRAVQSHVNFVALAAKTAGCKGIVFDVEPYGENPWNYSTQKYAKTKSYDEYAIMVRRRGRQFMRSLSGQMPVMKLLMFYQYSMAFSYASSDADPATRMSAIRNNPYGLMYPFLDGMLEEAGPGIQFIDGNEFSYYYRTAAEFYKAYYVMRNTAKQYVAPELRDKFDHQVRAAQALYVDFLFNMRPDIFPQSPSVTMNPEERAKWFAQNTYNALQSSDEYVWLYSENMNWWTDTSLPPGLTQAVVSARDHSERRQDIAMISRSARIARLTAGQAPVLDGLLNDAVYKEIKPLQPFVGLFDGADQSAPVKAPTEAWAAYDAQNLYVSLRNTEPFMNRLKSVGATRDSDVWQGDSLEISIRPNAASNAFYHFILNPDNVAWDGIDLDGSADTSVNPNWKSTVVRGPQEWTAEAMIPWGELNLSAPKSGSSLRVNLARNRQPAPEMTSWSQFQTGFREVQNFGTWIFE